MTPRLKLPTSGQKETRHQHPPSEDLSQKLGRRRRRPHRPVGFSTLAILLVGLAVPVVDGFLGPQGQVARLSALSRGGKDGLTTARSSVGLASGRKGALSTGFTKRYYTCIVYVYSSGTQNDASCFRNETLISAVCLGIFLVLYTVTARFLWVRNVCAS